jgi:hypothetical protein
LPTADFAITEQMLFDIQGTSKNRFSMHAHPVGMGSAAFPGQMRPKFTSD